VDEASILASKDPRFKGTDADVKTIFSHIFLKTPVADAKLVENAEVEAKIDKETPVKVCGCPGKREQRWYDADAVSSCGYSKITAKSSRRLPISLSPTPPTNLISSVGPRNRVPHWKSHRCVCDYCIHS
jgi:hypothetical protein